MNEIGATFIHGTVPSIILGALMVHSTV